MKIKTVIASSVGTEKSAKPKKPTTVKRTASKSRDSILDFSTLTGPGSVPADDLGGPLVDAETANLQWKFFCERFFRSISDIKALMSRAHPGSDREVLKQLNAGRDPLHVFSDYAVRSVNVFQAVSSTVGTSKIKLRLSDKPSCRSN